MDEESGCALGRIEQLLRYVYWKSGSRGFVIGVSGGIDSAVAATMCCRAVGPERVLGLILPSGVTDPADTADAEEVCRNLSMESRTISIDPILSAFRGMPGFSEDRYLLGNLMARSRMAVLYYHANREKRLVCGTSNRTEYMIGYCTKWGDNAADVQPLLHLYKTEVYGLAATMENIPDRVIRKAPTAGLWQVIISGLDALVVSDPTFCESLLRVFASCSRAAHAQQARLTWVIHVSNEAYDSLLKMARTQRRAC